MARKRKSAARKPKADPGTDKAARIAGFPVWRLYGVTWENSDHVRECGYFVHYEALVNDGWGLVAPACAGRSCATSASTASAPNPGPRRITRSRTAGCLWG